MSWCGWGLSRQKEKGEGELKTWGGGEDDCYCGNERGVLESWRDWKIQ